MALANVNVRFGADMKEFSTKMQNASRSLDKWGKKFNKVGKSLSMNLTAPLAGLAALSVKAFDTQAKAVAQVEAGLRSTGNAVGYTSEQLQKMASALQSNSLFGDEEILQGATAQLLTFTNIAGEQFAKTQKIALDLATRLDGDLKSSSIMLGKALNDPVANLSALSRAGIQFSEDQKAMVRTMVETNRLAEAQDLILEELEKQYGGSAKAAAEAGAGGLKQMHMAIGDLMEGFGEVITDALNPFAKTVKAVAERLQSLSASTRRTIVVVAAFAAAAGPLLVTLGFLSSTVIPALISGFTLLTGPIGLLTLALGGIVAAVMSNTAAAWEFRKAMDEAFIGVKSLDDATGDLVIALDALKTAKENGASQEELEMLRKTAKLRLQEAQAIYQRIKAGKELAIQQHQQRIAELERLNASSAAIEKTKELTGMIALYEEQLRMASEEMVSIQNKIDAMGESFDNVNINGDEIIDSVTKIGESLSAAIKPIENLQKRGLAGMNGEPPKLMHVPTNEELEKVRSMVKEQERMDRVQHNIQNSVMGVQGAFESFFDQLINGGQNAFQAFVTYIKRLIVRLVAAATAAFALSALLGGLGIKGFGFRKLFTQFSGFKLPGKAFGGRVSSMQPYMVGERGPELFIPGTSGVIRSNNTLGRGASVNVNLNGGFSLHGTTLISALNVSKEFKNRY